MTPSEGELFKKILGRFDIRIEIRHALLGLTFLQAGVFHEHAESGDDAATGEAA